ncbi:MAG: GTPase HflX, partial [Betaproteobacteria bacterium]|nr:GTPase HflX [Betaproteobacteria bacterium]
MNTLAQLERCILVGVDLGATGYDPDLEEFGLLAASCGFTACATLRARRKAPDAATFIGSGKVQELAALVQQFQPALVLIDQTISPIHQRNLARALSCPVMDRTGLILEIFAQRAKSHEG